ncbi:MAG: cytidylate kinase family protein [Candidatus Micrarchaeota archaeon]
MIITISGQPGSGNTTVSRLLAEKIGYSLVTAGEINKKIAAESGLSIEDYWKKLEKNPKEMRDFHDELDRRQEEIAKHEKNCIFNSKLGAFRFPNAGLKVLLVADDKVRAERTVKRDGGTVKQALKKIAERERMERKDWKKMYGFDYVGDKEKYDMIIDVSELSPEQIVGAIMSRIAG